MLLRSFSQRNRYQMVLPILSKSRGKTDISDVTLERQNLTRPETTSNLSWNVVPVGVVRSQYGAKFGTPKQATIQADKSLPSYVELFPAYRDCLQDLCEFTYCWVISYMHVNKGFKTRITTQPRLRPDGVTYTKPRPVGLFSSRAPHRPNPIAISCCHIESINMELGRIYIKGIDLLDDTPILDIKPYVPAFDAFPDASAGWMDEIDKEKEIHRNKQLGTVDSDMNRSEKKVSHIEYPYLHSRHFGYQDISSTKGAKRAKAGDKRRAMEAEVQVLDPSTPGTQ